MFYKKKSLYILLAVFLFSLLPVYSFNFASDITSVKNKITISQIAEFKVTIYNYEDTTETFRIKNKNYPSWDIRTDPISNPIFIIVPPESNNSINILVDPNSKYVAESGSHFVNFEIISESTNERLAQQVRVGMISSDEIQVGYVPTVILKTDFPEEINPFEELSFQITLSNQNNLDIADAKLILSSELINEEIDLNIMPKEEKIIDIKKQLDPKTKPIGDMLTLKLVYNNKDIFSPIVKKFKIVSYSEVVDDVTVDKSFLRRTDTIVFTNKGNVLFEGDLAVATTGIKRLFSSTDPGAVLVKKDGRSYYSWNVKLTPYESYSVKVKVNYLGIVVVLGVIIFIVLLFYLGRSPLVLRKDITETEVSEGGLSKLRILINIRNRSLKKIKDVSIIDKVPKLLDIEKHTSLGSLKPIKIKRNKKHETLVLWTVEELMPGEERVITYQLKSSLKILGGLSLQPAVSKFRQNDKEVKIRSNRSFVKV
ncbi:MAG: hypothetical protein KAK00_08470 [Nanoarchaeota archaeon]|nr:hypothetical protein [Nanoarchaeota archaeon]